MAEENTGSVPFEETGSPTTDPEVDATSGESGEDASSHVENSEVIPKTQYEELETLLGQQGVELGEYREFFNKVTPLLDKLESQPGLIQGILDDKINESLVDSVLSGDVSLKAAKEVTKAHKEVKKDLGKEYTGLSSEEIEKLVASKVAEQSSEIERRLTEKEELKNFEKSTSVFIENTKDFADYSDAISKWFEENPEQDDIRVAYDVVKGRDLSGKMAKQGEKDSTEDAKNVAANAAGGQSQQSGEIDNRNIADELISPRSNPNLL